MITTFDTTTALRPMMRPRTTLQVHQTSFTRDDELKIEKGKLFLAGTSTVICKATITRLIRLSSSTPCSIARVRQ